MRDVLLHETLLSSVLEENLLHELFDSVLRVMRTSTIQQTTRTGNWNINVLLGKKTAGKRAETRHSRHFHQLFRQQHDLSMILRTSTNRSTSRIDRPGEESTICSTVCRVTRSCGPTPARRSGRGSSSYSEKSSVSLQPNCSSGSEERRSWPLPWQSSASAERCGGSLLPGPWRHSSAHTAGHELRRTMCFCTPQRVATTVSETKWWQVTWESRLPATPPPLLPCQTLEKLLFKQHLDSEKVTVNCTGLVDVMSSFQVQHARAT